ncbi:site-specific integrase [Streptomyces parvus]|uniref:site-specific integrase n=1 Tax=Streptomyces parvus TaxID=66428 RepID=UPI0037094A96
MPGGVLPAGADGADVGEGPASTGDELERCVHRVVGVRLDASAGLVGGGQERAREGTLAPVPDGPGGLGEETEYAARLASVVQQPALLGPLTRGYSARARKRTELVHARVRTLQPLLSVLVEHVDTELVSARTLLSAVKEVQPGEEFTCDGRRYLRPLTRHDQQRVLWDGEAPFRCRDTETGEAVNAVVREDEAFWTWATVHVLRLTGIRVEELMELTHLSIRQYQRPNGELIGLLVIAPSKNDRERVIPMSAELFHAIAEILRRLTANGRPVRVLRRWDSHEKIMGEPLPFLFQRSMNHASGCISAPVVNRLLKAACKRLEAVDHRFHDVHFTAHDFRRLFATDLVNSGVPIHIGAALLGHLNIQTARLRGGLRRGRRAALPAVPRQPAPSPPRIRVPRPDRRRVARLRGALRHQEGRARPEQCSRPVDRAREGCLAERGGRTFPSDRFLVIE